MRWRECFGNSVKKHITGLFCLIFTIQILFLGLIVNYLSDSARGEIRDNEVNKLSLYGQSMHRDIEELDIQLKEVCYNVFSLNRSKSTIPDEGFFYRNSIFEILKYQMHLGTNADLIYVYSDEKKLNVSHKSGRVSTKDNLAAMEYMKQNRFEISAWSGDMWNVLQIGERTYLYMAKKIDDVTVVYACDVRTLMNLAVAETDQGSIRLMDEEGNVYYFMEKGEKKEDRSYLYPAMTEMEEENWIKQRVEGTPLYIAEQMDRMEGIIGWSRIQVLVFWFGGIAIVLLILLMRYLSGNLVRPINRLVDAMDERRQGVGREIPVEKRMPREISILYQAYNGMIRENAELKIAEYENRLELQNERIQGLMHQIKPHFYLNAMSTVFSMTYQHKDEDIRIFISNLSKYLRYTMNNRIRDVSLEAELEHCQYYIEMQKIRFPDRIFYFCDVAEGVETKEVMIAPLILHTLLENCFKHALNPMEILTIMIQITPGTKDDMEGTRIVVEDNGKGFCEEVLLKQEGVREAEDGVGLHNIRKQMSLTYGREDLLKLSNAVPHGARVTLFIPKKEEKNEAADCRR